MIKKQPKTSKEKPKKDKKFKYDWEALKREFFESSFMEVKAFFEQKYSTEVAFSGNVKKRTTGWPDEKKKWKQDTLILALENLKKEKSERVKNILDKILLLVESDIEMMLERGHVDEDALKKLWEIMRTEGGLPTRITHNTNTNTNFDAVKVRDGLLSKLKDKIKKGK